MRLFNPFTVLICSLLLTTSCATHPPAPDNALPDLTGLPQTLLAGATLEQARSVALANARTKGWTPVDSRPECVVLERELARNSPQAQALGPQHQQLPPRIRVETHFRPQADGVLVALRAFIISHPRDAEMQHLDYTTDYQVPLQASLAALQQEWQTGARPPVMPPTSTAAPDPSPAERPHADVQLTPPVTPPRQPTAAPPVVNRPSPPPNPAPAVAKPASPAPAHTVPALPPPERRPPVPVTALPPPAAPLPTSGLIPTPAPITNSVNETNPMLALNQNQPGLWAYYAEQYARTHGCTLTDNGAMLREKTISYELHTVPCADGRAFLLKCQGGVCQMAQ
ncbi:hypothetical protein [Thiospirillum jenense]|nr:hypothetical protein [Thiospirillum jenense]